MYYLIQRIISVYYSFGLLSIVSAAISMGNNNLVLSKLIVEIWGHSHITNKKSDKAINTSSQVIIRLYIVKLIPKLSFTNTHCGFGFLTTLICLLVYCAS